MAQASPDLPRFLKQGDRVRLIPFVADISKDRRTAYQCWPPSMAVEDFGGSLKWVAPRFLSPFLLLTLGKRGSEAE